MFKKTKMRQFALDLFFLRTGYQGTTSKGQMQLPNIHINKGKYPQSSKELYIFSTISDISCISQVYVDKPKQTTMQYAVGLQAAIPLAIPHVYVLRRSDKILLINMHKRLAVCNPPACYCYCLGLSP